MFLIFDTETTGLPKKWNAPISDSDNWPRCVQLAWQLHDIKGDLISNHSYLLKPEGFTIPFEAEKIHGISTDLASKIGKNINEVLELFISDCVGFQPFVRKFRYASCFCSLSFHHQAPGTLVCGGLILDSQHIPVSAFRKHGKDEVARRL